MLRIRDLAWCFFILFLMPISIYASDLSEESDIFNLKQLNITKGTFVQKKYFKVLKNPIVSKGDVFYHQKYGFLWQTNTPVKSGLVFKQAKLFSYESDLTLKEIKGANTLAQVLMGALSGDLSTLKEEFILVKIAGSNCLKLTPINDKLIKIINTVELCHTDNLLDRIVLIDQSQNKTDINVLLSPINKLPEKISAQLQ